MFQENSRILPLPLPWPWLVADGLSGTDRFQALLVGSLFLVPVIFAALAALRLLWAGRTTHPRIDVLAACLFTAIPFAHHAAVRSDYVHLATSFAPVAAGLLVLPFTFRKRTPRNGSGGDENDRPPSGRGKSGTGGRAAAAGSSPPSSWSWP